MPSTVEMKQPQQQIQNGETETDKYLRYQGHLNDTQQ
jgi:hypothetical protein